MSGTATLPAYVIIPFLWICFCSCVAWRRGPQNGLNAKSASGKVSYPPVSSTWGRIASWGCMLIH